MNVETKTAKLSVTNVDTDKMLDYYRKVAMSQANMIAMLLDTLPKSASKKIRADLEKLCTYSTQLVGGNPMQSYTTYHNLEGVVSYCNAVCLKSSKV